MPLIAPALSLLLLLLVASIVCDFVHIFLHAAQHSRWGLLRAVASLHQTHHEFLDRALIFHDRQLRQNFLRHHLPEFGVRLLVLFSVSRLLGVDHVVVVAAILLCVLDLFAVVVVRGRDAFHPRRRPLLASRSSVLVDAHYHALHHAFPDHFLAAHVQLLDRLFGRLLPLQDRHVVVVGGSAYCAALAKESGAGGARVTQVDVERVTEALLRSADIIVLGTGAGSRGLSSYEVLLLRAQQAHRERLLPLEVWTVGTSPAWAARHPLLVDERTVLRTLKRGPMLGAAFTLFCLRRGLLSV